MPTKYWIIKSEPEVFSIDDLAKSKKDSPTWFMADVKFVSKFSKPVSISEIKANKKLQKMQLIQRGKRLSVLPLTKDEFDETVKMGS